jgi:hypothetical protein
MEQPPHSALESVGHLIQTGKQSLADARQGEAAFRAGGTATVIAA